LYTAPISKRLGFKIFNLLLQVVRVLERIVTKVDIVLKDERELALGEETLFGLRSLKSRRQGNLSTNVHVQRVELVLMLVTTAEQLAKTRRDS